MVISDSNVTNNDTSWRVETEKMEDLVQICQTQSDHLKWIQIVVEHFLSESKWMTLKLNLTSAHL